MSRAARESYDKAVRSFGHPGLAALPAYGRLRQALSDLCNEATGDGGVKLSAFLEAVRDMAVTAPYGDLCPHCTKTCAQEHDHGEDAGYPRPCGAFATCWPHEAERNGEFIRGTYRCPQGHSWTCSYMITLPFTL